MEKIISIDKTYFNNIEKAVNSLNVFFSSDFKTKSFPDTSDDGELDGGIRSCIKAIDDVDSRWINEPELVSDAADKINVIKPELTEYSADRGEQDFFMFCADKRDTSLADLGHEYISFKSLQKISDNFEAFEKLMNGIYSFELFTKPSAYKNEIQLFSDNTSMSECEDVLGNEDTAIFDPKEYINGLFENDYINMPDGKEFDPETQLQRFLQFKDLEDVKVGIEEGITPIQNPVNVQEAAVINYFENAKPAHIKYSNGKWEVSQQFTKTVNDMVAALRKCDNSDDIESFIIDKAKDFSKNLESTVVPFIIVNAFNKKSNNQNGFKKYTDSYASIMSKNKGADRFKNYDLFTTFKADKEGTIKFIEDFCKLKLVNDKKASISNNTILTLFNIFDSRIYFDILYNMIPEKEKKDKGMDEDSFVKACRSRINKNSREANPYAKDTAKIDPDNTNQTTEEVQEFAYDMIKSMGDMNISDMVHSEAWYDMLRAEINTLSDGLYNAGIPISATNEYIGEAFDIVPQMNYSILMESDVMKRLTKSTTVLGILTGIGLGTTLGVGVGMVKGGFTLLELLMLQTISGTSFGIIANKNAKLMRGKGIKSELVRDINNVIRLLVKETDEIDTYILKELKKRCKSLAESLSFALKRKSMFKDNDRELLLDLHHSTTKIISKANPNNADMDSLKAVFKVFMKNAEDVLMMLLNVTEADIKADVAIASDEVENTENEESTETNDSEEEKTEESDESEETKESEEKEEPVEEEEKEEEKEEAEEVQEVYKGELPSYMNSRIQNTDSIGSNKTPEVSAVEVPSNDGSVPSNPINDLADSIEEKIDDGGDQMKDILGKEAKKDGSHIVVNVTNNYNYSNSFNKTSTSKTSNDFSTGKHTDQSVGKHVDHSISSNKDKEGSNNKYNSTDSSNSTEKKVVNEFSTGYTVDDLFNFFESGKPLLEASNAIEPKEDSLTRAIDRDRRKLPKQQAAKKSADKAVSTAKAVTAPIRRTKQWLLGIVDSLVRRKEDKVKADLIQNPSYRTAVFRAGRIALKAGLFGVFLTINGYLAAVYAVAVASNLYDKQRLRKEVEAEFATEINIINDKIRLAEEQNDHEAKWKMMRMRDKMERIATNEVMRTKVVHPTSAQ